MYLYVYVFEGNIAQRCSLRVVCDLMTILLSVCKKEIKLVVIASVQRIISNQNAITVHNIFFSVINYSKNICTTSFTF